MVVAHRVRIVRMRAPQRCRKGIGPRLLNVERDGIGEQHFEPLRGDLRRILEAIGFSGLEIEPQAGELIHDRAAERGRRAQQIEEKAIHHRKRADQHEGEWIVLDACPDCGKRIDKRLWRQLLQQ